MLLFLAMAIVTAQDNENVWGGNDIECIQLTGIHDHILWYQVALIDHFLVMIQSPWILETKGNPLNAVACCMLAGVKIFVSGCFTLVLITGVTFLFLFSKYHGHQSNYALTCFE